MQPVNLAKEQKKKQREEFLERWRKMSPQEKEAYIVESKAKHAKIFQANRAKEEAKVAEQKHASEVLEKHDARVYYDDCPVCYVVRPAKRDRNTKEVTREAILKQDPIDTFGIALSASIVEGLDKHNMHRIRITFAIRSPKDNENRKIARGHVGKRLEKASPFAFEIVAPAGIMNGRHEHELETQVWGAFDSFVTSPDCPLSIRFIRSWMNEHPFGFEY